jgi:FKBP-type peptidyl-prolyl cis-trans isomerase 2
MMRKAEIGDTVTVAYVMKAPDETVLDSRGADERLQFTLGEGAVNRGLERSLIGMRPGEKKRTQVAAVFGQYDEELRWKVNRARLPGAARSGSQLEVQVAGRPGEWLRAWVTDVSGETATVDANHPLAGMPITFEIELIALG